MTVTAVGTNFSAVHSVSGTRYLDPTGTVPSGASLLLCTVVWNNHGQAAPSVTWDPSGVAESMTSIVATTLDGDSSDTAVAVYGVVSPTAKTANIRVDFGSGATAPCAIAIGHSYSGSDTTDLATATNVVGSATNKAASTTTVITSGGSAGNHLVFCGGGSGDDMVPASNAESWTEISDSVNSGGGAGNNQDCSLYIAEKAAAAGITVTWGASDENAGHIIELVAASPAASITSVGPADLNIIYDDEIRVEIDGADFGASQGTGTVTLNDTDPETTTPTTTVAQTVTAWTDTKITITVDKGALASNLVWLGVTTDGGGSSDSKQITVKAAVPTLVSTRTTPSSKNISEGVAFSFDASPYFYSGDSQDRLEFSQSGLPAGLSISSGGVISGTVAVGESASSPFSVTITATDLDGNSANDSVSWAVTAPTPNPPTESPASARRRPRGMTKIGRCGRL